MMTYVLNIIKKYKEYKKLIKYKRRKYRDNLTEMLSKTMEHDPQAAWKIINELKNDSLPPDKSHFSPLQFRVRPQAATCGRVVVTHSRSVVFCGISGFFHQQ